MVATTIRIARSQNRMEMSGTLLGWSAQRSNADRWERRACARSALHIAGSARPTSRRPRTPARARRGSRGTTAAARMRTGGGRGRPLPTQRRSRATLLGAIDSSTASVRGPADLVAFGSALVGRQPSITRPQQRLDATLDSWSRPRLTEARPAPAPPAAPGTRRVGPARTAVWRPRDGQPRRSSTPLA